MVSVPLRRPAETRRAMINALVARATFWMLALAVGVGSIRAHEPRIACVGVAVGAVLATRVGLPERAFITLNAIVLVNTLAGGLWVAMVLATGALLIVPGLLLLEAAGLPRSHLLRFPPFVPAASVVALAACALLANFAGPPLGVEDPLDAYPLLVSLDVVLVALGLAALARPPRGGPATRTLVDLMPRVREGWPLLLPIAAATGAGAVSETGDNRIAIATLVASLAALLVGLVLAGRGETTRAAIALFGAVLACIYSFTLPGTAVFGFDITGEYGTLTALLQSGHWQRLHENDAYGAMLSLTLVPATFHALAGLSAALILKAVYPVFLALFPVSTFLVARRFVSTRAAYVAAIVIVAQAPLLQQLPAIARQEMALLEFATLVAALTDRHLPVRCRRALIGVFGVGLVVSHYSTAYATITLLALGVGVAVALRLAGRRVALLSTVVFALVVVGGFAAVWYGPVTESYSNAGSTFGAIADDGLNLLPSSNGEGVLGAYLHGNSGGTLRATTYEAKVATQYAKDRPWVIPLAASDDPRYVLRDNGVPQTGDVALINRLHSANALVEQLVNLLAVVGTLALALRRRSSPVARLIGALGVGMLAILAVARLSGTVATVYNLERLDVQSLFLTGVGVAFLCDRAFARNALGQFVVGVFVVGLMIVVVVGSGLGAVVTGAGNTANLYRSGEDYERFTISPGEQAAARWLGMHAPARAEIYADRYAQLRLFAFAGRGSSFLNAVTPKTLDQHAWVYASRSNWVDDRARDVVGRDLVTFRFPRPYLDANYDRWYASEQGAVYRR